MDLLIHVFIYCIVLSVYLFATLAVNPRIWLHRMPKVVVEKVAPRTKRESRLLIFLGVPFVLFTLLYPSIYIFLNCIDLFAFVVVYFVFLFSFDLWDTLLLDVLIFCTITPKFVIIDETEKKDYQEKRYHIESGLKGSLLAVLGSIILGPLLFLIKYGV